MGSDEILTAADSANYEEIGECPSFIDQPQAFTEYQVKENLQLRQLLGDEDSDFLMSTYHSPIPSEWNFKIYLQYISNSSALDELKHLFEDPEDVVTSSEDQGVLLGQSGGEEYIAFGHVGSIIGDLGQNIVDGVKAAEDITYSNSCANGDYEHILLGDDEVFCAQEELQDNSDMEFGYNSCDSEDIVLNYGLASKLNGIMIVCAVIRDYYMATMTLKRSYQEKTKFYGRTYCRYWFDRGKSDN